MCGVYGLSMEAKYDFEYRFHMESDAVFREMDIFQYYPGSNIPTILKNSPPSAKLMRWGLQPIWIRNRDDLKFPTFNCRIEGFQDKPTWKHAWQSKQRCLIVATHFFEWKRTEEGKKTRKVPYIIRVKDEDVFAFAGLFEVHGDEYSVTMFTAEAEPGFAKIHHRVPVILEQDQEQAWIDKDTPIEEALKMLKPTADSRLEIAEGGPR